MRMTAFSTFYSEKLLEKKMKEYCMSLEYIINHILTLIFTYVNSATREIAPYEILFN